MWKDRRCGANRTPRPDRRAKWINVEAAAEDAESSRPAGAEVVEEPAQRRGHPFHHLIQRGDFVANDRGGAAASSQVRGLAAGPRLGQEGRFVGLVRPFRRQWGPIRQRQCGVLVDEPGQGLLAPAPLIDQAEPGLADKDFTLDSGSVSWGHEAQIGYFPQDVGATIEHGLTVAEWLHRWKPDAHVEDIRGILGQMLFSGEEGDKQTKALSGGEQARLAFCKLILTKPNILIFDEPTNHLDLEAINALNIALQRYEGTVLLVTHDHDLIDEVATRLWVFHEDGIEDFQGPYEEWKGKHN